MKSRFITLPLVLVLAAVVTWSAYMLIASGRPEEKKSVSVILPGNTETRWNALKAGMDQAAIDNNVDLNYISVEEGLLLTKEEKLINEAIEEGSDAVIFQPVASEGLYDFKDNNYYGNKLVLIDSDISQEGVYLSVTADNEEVGRKMAEAIRNEHGSNIYKMKIAMLVGPSDQYAMEERLRGFFSVMDETKLNIIWRLNSSDDLAGILSEQTILPDVIIAFDSNVTEAAVDFALEHDLDCEIYGEGYSEKAVYYMDKGLVKNLTVPNEFNMGYLSVEFACRSNSQLTSIGNRQVEIVNVSLENLYKDDIQALMFPKIR